MSLLGNSFSKIVKSCPKTFNDKILYQSHLSEHIASKMKTHANACNSADYAQNCSASSSCSALPSCTASSNSPMSPCSSVSSNAFKSLSLTHSLQSQKPYKCSICNEEFSIKEDKIILLKQEVFPELLTKVNMQFHTSHFVEMKKNKFQNLDHLLRSWLQESLDYSSLNEENKWN